jgi:hypothetical protein
VKQACFFYLSELSMKIWYQYVVPATLLQLCIFMTASTPSVSYSASCVIDGLEGTWVNITQYVPEGECLDTAFDSHVVNYNNDPTPDFYYFFGKSEKYQILIPSTGFKARLCTEPLYYTSPDIGCNCEEDHSVAIAKDAYYDCWKISDRCQGKSCYGYELYKAVLPPSCTDCWFSYCSYILPDNAPYYTWVRTVYECVSNNCLTAYYNKQHDCGNARTVNWNNKTCTGECDSCTIDQYKAAIEKCDGIQNISGWDSVNCTGLCTNKNLGPCEK